MNCSRTNCPPERRFPYVSEHNRMNFSPIGSNLMHSNQVRSVPMSSNSIGLDQISFNRDGFYAGSSNPNQSNTTDSSQNAVQWIAVRLNPDQVNQMPSSRLSASRLDPGSASTSLFDQFVPLQTHRNFGLRARDSN